MKHYFIVKTSDNEWNSSIKYIAETFEEAERFLKNDKSGWYSPKGTGHIEEVDKYAHTLKDWQYFDGHCSEAFDWVKGDYIN